jgi:heme A synthase
MMQNRRFAAYAWGVLAFNVLVIAWGASVRATGSGAGCGNHWPMCNGDLVPFGAKLATLIEYSHRMSSGLDLLLVVALIPLAWRTFGRGHRVRVMAVVSLAFILMEALLGAGLVLLEYVALNVSVARAYWVAAHLINTFLLLAALTITAWWGGGAPSIRLRHQPTVLVAGLGAALVGMLILGASGALTALGDTLLLTSGITPEQSALVATLVDLRTFHPILALIVGVLIFVALLTARAQRPSAAINRLSWLLGAIFVVQLLVGAFNVALLTPIALQLIHLVIADLIWISLILLAANALAAQPSVQEAEASPSPSATFADHRL